MSRYVCGPSVLRLTGRVGAVIPGDVFEHDFSPDGPEGSDGPAREAANLLAGAFTLAPGETTEAAKRTAAVEAAAAAARVDATAAESETEPQAADVHQDAGTTDTDNKGE